MLGSISIFSAKGMVEVPNLTGLTSAGIQQTLTSLGLGYQNSGSINTQNSNLNGLLASQSVAPGVLVDYESVISYETYTYVATQTPTPTPTIPGGVTTTVSFAYCSGTNQVTSGTAIRDGSDASSICTTLRSEYGNPTGWVCGTSENPSPSVSCATPEPTPTPAVTYNCRAWIATSSQPSSGYYSSSTNDDNQSNLPCNYVSVLCVQSPSIPGTNMVTPYYCTQSPAPTATPAPTVWYCTTSLAYSSSQSYYTSSSNESGTSCDSYRTVCSTSGYQYASPPAACPTSAPTTAVPTTTAARTCTASCGAWTQCSGIMKSRFCTASDCSTYTEYAIC